MVSGNPARRRQRRLTFAVPSLRLRPQGRDDKATPLFGLEKHAFFSTRRRGRMHSGSFWSPRNPVDDTAPSSGLSHLVSLRSSGSAGDCVSVPSRAAQHRRLDPGLLRCPSVRSRGLDGGRRIDSAAGSGLVKQGRFCRDEVGRQPLHGETRSALPHRPASSPHPRGTWLHEDLSLKV